jgi:acyl carrier protein
MTRAADSESIKAKLKEFICRRLMRRPDYPLADDEPLISGGLIDSMSLAEVGVFIEREFHVYIPDSNLTADHIDTLHQMVDLVREELSE